MILVVNLVCFVLLHILHPQHICQNTPDSFDGVIGDKFQQEWRFSNSMNLKMTNAILDLDDMDCDEPTLRKQASLFCFTGFFTSLRLGGTTVGFFLGDEIESCVRLNDPDRLFNPVNPDLAWA